MKNSHSCPNCMSNQTRRSRVQSSWERVASPLVEPRRCFFCGKRHFRFRLGFASVMGLIVFLSRPLGTEY